MGAAHPWIFFLAACSPEVVPARPAADLIHPEAALPMAPPGAELMAPVREVMVPVPEATAPVPAVPVQICLTHCLDHSALTAVPEHTEPADMEAVPLAEVPMEAILTEAVPMAEVPTETADIITPIPTEETPDTARAATAHPAHRTLQIC